MFFELLIPIVTIYNKEAVKDGNVNYVCLAQHYLHEQRLGREGI